jgi:hypothetical protein
MRRLGNHRHRILLLRDAPHRAATESKKAKWKKQTNLPKHPHQA